MGQALLSVPGKHRHDKEKDISPHPGKKEEVMKQNMWL